MNSQSNQVSNQSWSPFSTPYLFDSTSNMTERPSFQYSTLNSQSYLQQNDSHNKGN